MKIALLGYGKMGKAIEEQILKDEVLIIKDKDLAKIHDILSESKPDVVIEFTQPDAVISHIKMCMDLTIPIVTGTTGWDEQKTEINAYCEQKNGALFYASNFSIGANIFFEINNTLAQLMNHYPDYDVSIFEEHHIEKKDKPSGTAIKIGQDILDRLDRKEKLGMDEVSSAGLLSISSERIGDTKGLHAVKYSSNEDQILITHDAKNRNGFAKGALLAARWVIDKKGVYGMSDLLRDK